MPRSLLLASLIAFTTAASAQDKPTVELDLVYATRGAAAVDPALADVAADLRSLPYQHFDRVGGASLPMAPGDKAVADLGHGVKVTVTLRSVTADAASVHVLIVRDGATVIDTQVDRPLKRASVLSVGKAEQGLLVVPILVRR